MNAYAHDDYRDFVLAWANARKADGYRYADLAKSLRIQPTYLSRVSQKDAHLSSDQLYLFSGTAGLSEKELDFLNLSLEYLRASLPERRQSLYKRMQKLQKARLDPKDILQAQTEAGETTRLQEYFLEPLAPLIHVFLSVPRYKKNPDKIRRALGISIHRFSAILQHLERLGMIGLNKRGTYQLLRDHLHLERGSILHENYQLMSRAASSEHCKKIDKDNKFQFTVTFGADERTSLKIREEFNKFLKLAEELCRNTSSEGVYQMNFDLFRWDFESRAESGITGPYHHSEVTL